MEKHVVALMFLIFTGTLSQTTNTVMETDVSVGDELQTEMSSTSMPSSSSPEVSSDEEETEVASNTDGPERVETQTESGPSTTSQSTGEDSEQERNENTEIGIEIEDSTSGGTRQEQVEPVTEDGGTVAQASTENSAMPQEPTTSQPTVQEETGSQSPVLETSSPQPEVLQSTTVDGSIPQSTSQENNVMPEVTTVRTETEQPGPTASSADQETSTAQQESSSELLEMTTVTRSTSEEGNPKDSPGETRTTDPTRSAVEGDTVTVRIVNDNSNTDSSTVGSIAEDDTECPTNCTAGAGDPTCGSDQRVYENECHLKRDTCGKNVTVATWELCRGKHDICPAQCLNIQDPVCGEDGKIYPNLCLMFKFNCGKRMRTYDLVRCVNRYRGFRRLDGACPKFCHELYRPVCGSDGKVYSNECYLRLQTCGRNVRAVEMSLCVDTPSCPHTCTPLYDPVCGSDGRLYLNHCYFANLNCGKKTTKVDTSYCESFQHLKK